MKIEVKNTDLASALSAAVLFAGKDKTPPVLQAVKLEARGGALYAMATDRYGLGVYRIATDADAKPFEDTFSVMIPTDEVAGLVKLAKSCNFPYPVTLTLADDGQRLTVDFLGSSVTFAVPDHNFPAVGVILAETAKTLSEADASAVARGLNPRQLALFTKIADKREYVTFYAGASNKPYMVTVGESFVALLMPLNRPGSGLPSIPAWVQGVSA